MNPKETNYGSLDASRVSMVQRLSVSAHPTLNEKICLNLILIQDNVRKLNSHFTAIGTNLDNHRLRKQIREMQKTTNETVKFTNVLINKLNTIVKSTRALKPLKVMSEKLIRDFDTIQKKFMQLDKQLNTKIHKNPLAYNPEEDEVEQLPGTSTRLLQEQQQFLPIDQNFEIQLMLEQEQSVNEIEGDVKELSQMMGKLAEIVNQQGEKVSNIEDKVTDAAIDVQEGEVQLRNASSLMQKIRKKALIIFIILLILAIIVFALVFSKFRK